MIAAQEYLTVYRGGRARRLRPEAHPRLGDVTPFDARHRWPRARDHLGRGGYARPLPASATKPGPLAPGLRYLFVPDDSEAVVLFDFALTFAVSVAERRERRAERQRARRRRLRRAA